MENNQLLNDARRHAENGISAWIDAERDRPDAEEPSRARARILSLMPSAQGVLLHVASDGLTLDRKLALERCISEAARAAGFPPITVYFRRADAKAQSGPQPVPVTQKPGALGLNFKRRAIAGVREVIVVASGKGGVGKSTVATNLALAMQSQGARVGLLDADVYGPSVPLMLGLGGGMQVDAASRLLPREAHGLKVVSFALFTAVEQPLIWRGPLVHKALRQLLYDVAWGDLTHLIIDLPPGTGDVQLTLIEGLPIHGAVVVTTPQDVALIDAQKAISMFNKLEVPILGLVENMSYWQCSACGHHDHVFGSDGGVELAKSRGLQLLGRIPLLRGIRENADAGRPSALAAEASIRQPFQDLATQLLATQ